MCRIKKEQISVNFKYARITYRPTWVNFLVIPDPNELIYVYLIL